MEKCPSLTLLRDLHEAQIAVNALSGGVLVLITPHKVRLELLSGAGEFERLYDLVQEYDHFVSLLTDCARMSRCEAEACAWRLLLASHIPIEGEDT